MASIRGPVAFHPALTIGRLSLLRVRRSDPSSGCHSGRTGPLCVRTVRNRKHSTSVRASARHQLQDDILQGGSCGEAVMHDGGGLSWTLRNAASWAACRLIGVDGRDINLQATHGRGVSFPFAAGSERIQTYINACIAQQSRRQRANYARLLYPSRVLSRLVSFQTEI